MNTCWFQTNHTEMVVISIVAILNIAIITFNSGPTTTAEQQTTTDETTTMKTNDGSKDNEIAIIIGTVSGACALIVIIRLISIVLAN